MLRLNYLKLNKKIIINILLIVIYIIKLISCSTLDIYKNARLGHRIVQTRYGRLHGLILPLDNYRFLRSVEAYLGVPYATPPIKQNRFSPTKAPAPWDGIRISDKYSPVCPQRLPNIQNETAALEKMPKGRLEYLKRLMPFLQNQSEDCLYLNIFSPAHAATSEKKLPVIVFLHGESFEWSSGNPYDGSVLASYGEVVVVTLNYRLGLLGFLNASPQKRGRVANYGLLDQMAALHWIQGNIMNFGGDPERVTLAGHGTGAACINFLMTSPMANQNGLFQRVILMSGSSYSSWALVDDPVIYAIKLAKEVNCSIPDDLIKQHEKIVDCLREVPLDDLFSADIQAPSFLTAFGPSVDGVVIHAGQSNLDLDEQITNNRNIKRTSSGSPSEKPGRDILFGVVTGEAIWRFSAHDIQNGFEGERRDKIIRTYVRNAYNYHLNEIFYTIVNEYTDWERTSQHPINTRDTAVAALSDAQFVAPLVRTGDMLAPVATPQGQEKIGPRCYFYVFDYQTKDGDYPQRMGTVHGEDLPYMFGAPLVDGFSHFPSNYTKSEVALSEAVMIYLTNFARTGNPNEHHRQDSVLPASKERNRFRSITWDEYDSLHQKYLEIGMKPRIKNHFRAHQLSIWLRLIPELHKAGMEDVIARHNMFRNHDDINMYDGLIKPDSLSSRLSYLEDAYKRNRTGSDLMLNGVTTVEPMTFTTCIPLSGNYSGAGPFSPTTIVNATTDTLSGFEAAGYAAYSTALSVTIAIGCSLLILNVLIFAGVYYQRDKTRLEVKSLQKQYQQRGIHPHQQVPPFDPIKHAHYHMGHSQSANVIVDVENHHDQGTILLSNEVKSPHICSNTMQINNSCTGGGGGSNNTGGSGQNKIPLNENINYSKINHQQQQLKTGPQNFPRPNSQCSNQGSNTNYNSGLMTLPKSIHHSSSINYARAGGGPNNNPGGGGGVVGVSSGNVGGSGNVISANYGDCMTLPRNISHNSNNPNSTDGQQIKLPNGSVMGGVHHLRSTGPRPPIRTASTVITNQPPDIQQQHQQHQHHQQQTVINQSHHQHGPTTLIKHSHQDNSSNNQCGNNGQNLQMTTSSHLQQQVPQAAMDEMRV